MCWCVVLIVIDSYVMAMVVIWKLFPPSSSFFCKSFFRNAAKNIKYSPRGSTGMTADKPLFLHLEVMFYGVSCDMAGHRQGLIICRVGYPTHPYFPRNKCVTAGVSCRVCRIAESGIPSRLVEIGMQNEASAWQALAFHVGRMISTA